MKRFITGCLLATAIGVTPISQAQTLFVSPDVPVEPAGVSTLPWEATSVPGFVPTLGLPEEPQLDALHRLDRGRAWLVSVEVPSLFGGALATPALPADLVEVDLSAGTFSRFFCGHELAPGPGVPFDVNLDAAYQVGGDRSGLLVVSFDTPVDIYGPVIEPADLARFRRVGASCRDWTFVGLEFDASAAGSGIPLEANVIGAAFAGGRYLLTVDVPLRVAPSLGPPTYLPGQVVSTNGAFYTLERDLAPFGWDIDTQIDALSCAGNPGRIETTAAQLTMDKAAGGDVTLKWPAGCSAGGETYAIYEGSIAAITAGTYDHTSIVCTDAPPMLEETLTPAAASSYYLVVPHNDKDEGSYGRTSAGIERPVSAAACIATQSITTCP